MPLGAARITLLAKSAVVAAGTVIRGEVFIGSFGNAQISTTQSKIGGSSVKFDGTGDYLTVKDYNNKVHSWTDSDYTLEAWVYVTSSNHDSTNNVPNMFGNGAPTSGTNYWSFGYSNSGYLKLFYYSGSGIHTCVATSGAISTNTWTHIAFTYSSGTVKLWKDGTLVHTHTVSGTPQFNDGIALTVGQQNNYCMNGYIDEVRVSNTVRYTTSFTPSTTAFTNDENTLFLGHFDGANGATVMSDDNGFTETAPEAVSFDRSSETSGERINVSSLTNKPSDSYYSIVSAWVKLDSLPANSSSNYCILGGSNTDDGNAPILFEVIYNKKFRHYMHYRSNYTTLDISFPTMKTGEWYHVIAKHNGSGSGVRQMWVNGVKIYEGVAQNYGVYVPWSGNLRSGQGVLEQYTIGAYTSDNSNFSRFFDGCIAQVCHWATDIDISANIDKFYDQGFVDMGSDGTGSGLTAPDIYHVGNTQALFDDANGSMTGSVSVSGTLSSCS